MKGVVKYERGAGFVDYRDVEEEELGANQVRVEVIATGICGSDIHILHDTINYRIRTPVVMGHEFSGVVVAKGDGVGDEVTIGDRVTGEPGIHTCGRCDLCLSEHANLCPARRVMGYWHHGSFAPFVNVTNVHRLPDNVDFDSGALTELLACCVHAVTEQVGVAAGDVVAVTGPGPVGLFASLVAMAEGATVLLCGRSVDQARLRLAREIGVHHVVDVETEDPVSLVQALTYGNGADVVVECAGSAAAIDTALALVRKRGRYSQMGLPGRAVEVDFERVAYKELQLSGGIGQRRPAWKRALKLMEAGLIPTEKLVTHDFGMGDWEKGFAVAEQQQGIKVLLRP